MSGLAWYVDPNGIENGKKYCHIDPYPTCINKCEILIIESE
jgi:hypothetical protein